MVSLGLDGIDQFGNPTYIIARISDARSDINLGAFSQAVGTNNTNITVSAALLIQWNLSIVGTGHLFITASLLSHKMV